MSHEDEGDMAMSDMAEEESFKTSTTAETETGSLSDMESFRVATITDAQESCSHCTMYPQSGVNSPSAAIVVNNSTSHHIVPAASGIVSALVISPRIFVDVHDHGPPGLNGSRYILNSSFRI